jgi:hypothetical protein
MNVSKRQSTGFAASLAFALAALAAAPSRAGDAATDFAKTGLGVDLARYTFGASATNFPELLPTEPKAVTPWRRVQITRTTAAGASVPADLDLRFEADRLVELRTIVADFSTASPVREMDRLLAEFKKLGASAKKNSNRFVLETPARTISAEGYCSISNMMVLQFHVTPPPPRRGSP